MRITEAAEAGMQGEGGGAVKGGLPWWHPEALGHRLGFLAARDQVREAIRGWFRARDFAEVDTPILQHCPGVEVHIGPLPVEVRSAAGEAPRRAHLHTSPELAMKKLLIGGMPRLFQFARCFRDGEASPLHQPEFTMLEWYRAGEDYEVLMGDCAALLRTIATAAEVEIFKHGEVEVSVGARPERLTVAEAFARHAGIDVLATVPDPWTLEPDPAPLAAEAARIGVRTGPEDRWDDVFYRIMLERIEPHLGRTAPTFLDQFPSCLGALARRKPDDPRVVERFELFLCGVELANAFGELTDPAEQRARFEADHAKRVALYGEAAPIDEEFLTALRTIGMPRCSGIALGFDRLVMLASGADHIDQVQWAPVRI